MKKEDRVNVSISAFGSVTVSLFYYHEWKFFVGANYAENAESVIDRIEDKYLDGVQTRKHLRKGFKKYRPELEAVVQNKLGGEEK